MYLLKYSGLNDFFELFNMAVNISSFDSEGLPTVDMINNIGENFYIDMNYKDFWKCVEFAIISVRNKAIQDRKIKLAKQTK